MWRTAAYNGPVVDPVRASSSLLLLIDALDRCVEPVHHTQLIGDALHGAGLADIPPDTPAFRAFVSGPLQYATQQRLGDGVATELTWTLMRMTSVRAPSSRAPRSSRSSHRLETVDYADSSPPSRPGSHDGQTMEYNEDLFAPRIDVLLIDPDEALYGELQIHLEARDYRVARVAKLAASHGLTRDAAPRVVLTNIELEPALRVAKQLQHDLGEDGTRVIVLTDGPATPRVDGVARFMSPAPLAPIVEAVVAVIGPRP